MLMSFLMLLNMLVLVHLYPYAALLRLSTVCVCEYMAAVPGYVMLLMSVLVRVTLPLMMYKACMIKLWCIQASIVVMAYFD